MKRTKFDQFSFCDIDDKELFLIHSVIMYETTNDEQKRNRIIAEFTSNYNSRAYSCLMSYNAEMAEHYLTYWYEKRYGTKLFSETEEVEKEEVEKEKNRRTRTTRGQCYNLVNYGYNNFHRNYYYCNLRRLKMNNDIRRKIIK